MAKKKPSKKKVSSPDEFSSSPFKNLKGLSVLAEQKSLPQGGVTKRTTIVVKEPDEIPSGHPSFADEMDSLGVRPLPGRIAKEFDCECKPEGKPKQSSTTSREERDRAAFLDALGSVEKVFKDEWPEEEPVKLAVPRRMKQVERGKLKPQAALDLHGLTVDEASVKVSFFLQDASYQGFQTVLIITGKGVHSSDGPVLRKAIETLLNQQRKHLIEWGVAPRRFGGEGALIVFLRQEAKG